jgi:hypothetical protein
MRRLRAVRDLLHNFAVFCLARPQSINAMTARTTSESAFKHAYLICTRESVDVGRKPADVLAWLKDVNRERFRVIESGLAQYKTVDAHNYHH